VVSAERRRRSALVGHGAWVGPDRALRHGDGELEPVAIEDGAARGGERDVGQALRLSFGSQVVLIDRLQHADAGHHHHEQQCHGEEEDDEPAPGAARAPELDGPRQRLAARGRTGAPPQLGGDRGHGVAPT
jgi:hypothetical protein